MSKHYQDINMDALGGIFYKNGAIKIFKILLPIIIIYRGEGINFIIFIISCMNVGTYLCLMNYVHR